MAQANTVYTILTLPVEYRPMFGVNHTICLLSGGVVGGVARLTIGSDGQMKIDSEKAGQYEYLFSLTYLCNDIS